MKMTKIVAALGMLSLLAACGGGGGGETPAQPTSEQTKALAAAAQDRGLQAMGDAMDSGFQNFNVVTNIAADAAPDKAGQNYSGAITVNRNCGDAPESGSYTASGTLTAVCTGSPETAWSCTNFALQNLVITFIDCHVSVVQGATTYEEVMSGTTSGTITSGTVSGTGEGTPTTMSIAGTLSGTATLAGMATGSVDLAGTTFLYGIVEGEPEPTCGGTCSVTITDPAEAAGTQSCTVNTTCDGCQA